MTVGDFTKFDGVESAGLLCWVVYKYSRLSVYVRKAEAVDATEMVV